MQKQLKRIKQISQTISKIKVTDGKTPMDQLKTEGMKDKTTLNNYKKYQKLQKERAGDRRELSALKTRAKNIIFVKRNSLLGKALRKGAREGFKMVSVLTKPKPQKDLTRKTCT